tara:strand:+ start:260 stop:1363 length:1104 start_codon:yes stop_codon:yes gene_type:complete
MIKVADIKKNLDKNNISFFTGVPDSVLKSLTSIFEQENKNHIVATNEGSAVSIGIGHYLATKKLPCIYLQNSGLGNAINPLASISHSKVYSIPMLMIIGWRGAPGIKDEPQHMVKGRITKKLLKLLNIRFCILKSKKDLQKLNEIINYSKKNKKPVACLIDNKTLELKKKIIKKNNRFFKLNRIYVLRNIINRCKSNTKIISTTGYTSRELLHLRKNEKNNKGKDFYMVGGMGHATSVALGVSIFSKKQTLCLDGDGSILMHLGSVASTGVFGKKNFKHILFNNNSHESVGGQTTNAIKINFEKLSKSLGYKNFYLVKNKYELDKKLKAFFKSNGPSLMEIRIRTGSIKNLLRPKNLKDIKENFIKK